MSATFPCSAGGAVALGRRRLRRALGALLVLMLIFAIWSFSQGRLGAGLIALVAAMGPLVSLGLFTETDLEGLEVGNGLLVIRSSSNVERVRLAGASVRRLTSEEILHLERLANTGGIVAGGGGYDSGQLGEFDLFATNLTHAVMVTAETDQKIKGKVEPDIRRVVVTPDDPEAFLEAVTQQL